MTIRKQSSVKRSLTQRYRDFENAPTKIPEISALILYVVLICVISAFHEPWFDEAQAWQIAKCASLRDILFTIPHFEGHPPLWHLLLYLPARLGAPYEWAIKSLNILLCSCAVWILLFRAPFQRLVRISIPFTYFLFYQYGVIARPYSILFLAFMLAAAAYPTKNTRPFRFVLTLILLCLSSAYGIVFAGGIALVWVIEILREHGLKRLSAAILKDRRFFALGLLLLIAVVFILEIIPSSDAYAVTSQNVQNSFLTRVLYTSIILPADATFYNCFSAVGNLSVEPFDPTVFVTGIFLGILFWVALLFLSRPKKTTLLLVLPYSLYALFSSTVYFHLYHIGTATLFLLFWFWVDAGMRAENTPLSSQDTAEESAESQRAAKIEEFRHALRVFCAVLILSVSIFWTITACCNEITYPYGYGRAASAVLKENHLEDRLIMCSWREEEDAATGSIQVDTNYSGGVTILPYFDKNIVSNLNGGADSLAYMTHQRADDETNQANFLAWAARGIPNVLLGWVNLPAVFGDAISMDDYTPIATLQQGMIWKSILLESEYSIYVRTD